MAIVDKTTGRYIKISSINIKHGVVTIEIYQNIEHRKTGNKEFQTSYKKEISSDDFVRKILRSNAIQNKTIEESLYSVAYKNLKTLEEYSGCEDHLGAL